MGDDRNLEDLNLNVSGDVDNLVQHLSKEWAKEQHVDPLKQNSVIKDASLGGGYSGVAPKDVFQGTTAGSGGKNASLQAASPLHDTGFAKDLGEGAGISFNCHHRSGIQRNVKQTSSCPPGRVHSLSAGPWSLEWVRRHQQVVAGDSKQRFNLVDKKSNSITNRVTRRKGSGVLRHCAHKLKRIAQLSEEDRKEVLRALRKTNRRRKVHSVCSKDKEISNDSSSVNGSQSSVNNDWMNWLVLHGNSKVMSDDVKGMGKAVGLSFKGDKHNMFEVLSGAGRKIRESDGLGK